MLIIEEYLFTAYLEQMRILLGITINFCSHIKRLPETHAVSSHRNEMPVQLQY